MERITATNLFTSQDREDIRKLPLSTNTEDKIHWVHDPKGIYSIKGECKQAWIAKCNAVFGENIGASSLQCLKQFKNTWK